MRISKKNASRGAIALLAFVACACFVFSNSSSAPLKAAPLVNKPVTASSASPSSSPTASQPVPTSSAAPSLAASASPTLSEADVKALVAVDSHWNAFVDALNKTGGTKLSAEGQLIKPTVSVVAKLPDCPPDAENRLPATIKATVAFCDGKIRVVPQLFNKLSKGNQRRAVAGAFIYHALATTTPEQRSFNYNRPRNDAEVLGCLQASLSRAFEHSGGQPEDVWVVMSPELDGGAVYSAYWATIDWDGEWQ